MIVKPKRKNKKSAEAVCNLCGDKLRLCDLRNRFVIDRQISYGSEYNGSRVVLRMCCSCFDRLVEGCAITPIDQTKTGEDL